MAAKTLGDLADELWSNQNGLKSKEVPVTLCEKNRLKDKSPSCGFSDKSCGFLISRVDKKWNLEGKNSETATMKLFFKKKKQERMVKLTCLCEHKDLPPFVSTRVFGIEVTGFVLPRKANKPIYGSEANTPICVGVAALFVTKTGEVLVMKNMNSKTWLGLKWATPEEMKTQLVTNGKGIVNGLCYRELTTLAKEPIPEKEFEYLWGAEYTEENRGILRIVHELASERLSPPEEEPASERIPPPMEEPTSERISQIVKEPASKRLDETKEKEFINARWDTVKGSVDLALRGKVNPKSKLLVRSWATVVNEATEELPQLESSIENLTEGSVKHKMLEWEEDGVPFRRMVFLVPLNPELHESLQKDMEAEGDGLETKSYKTKGEFDQIGFVAIDKMQSKVPSLFETLGLSEVDGEESEADGEESEADGEESEADGEESEADGEESKMHRGFKTLSLEENTVIRNSSALVTALKEFAKAL